MADGAAEKIVASLFFKDEAEPGEGIEGNEDFQKAFAARYPRTADGQSLADFQLYDRGLLLVRDVQLFPHCMERIQTDDPDNLAYLARRFRHQVCVGLNQRSFLLLELAPRRATSAGAEDGVYVFGPDGQKRCYRAGEEVPFG